MNNALRKTIGGVNAIINFAVVVFLVLLMIVGCYAIGDTKLVHTQANKQVGADYKPRDFPAYSYDELRAQNSDVIGGLDVYGTGIDYPVMYSPEQSYYLFRDPFKRNSMIGSIFMDSDGDPNWTDYQTILYGHHMEAHCMFGDVPNFDKQDYFDSHEHGDLYFGDKHHGLKIIGLIKTGSYDNFIFSVRHSRAGEEAFMSKLKANSLRGRDDYTFGTDQIVFLSTCSDETESSRTILVTALCDQTFENPFKEEANFGPGVDDLKGWLGFPGVAWFAGLVVVVMVTIYILGQINVKNEKMKIERMVNNYDK